MARSLLANPDLPHRLQAGAPGPERPCTYCNKCLLNVIENPLGCYEESRFSSYDEMMSVLMSFYQDETCIPPEPPPARRIPPPRRTPPPGSRCEDIVNIIQFWRYVFYFKGIFNWVLSLSFHFGDGAIREYLKVATPADPVYRDLFLTSALVFGAGFWRTGRAPLEHLDIVRLGIFAQLAVFLVLTSYFAMGKIPFLQALPGFVDLAFAILYIIFLAKVRQNVASAGSCRNLSGESGAPTAEVAGVVLESCPTRSTWPFVL